MSNQPAFELGIARPEPDPIAHVVVLPSPAGVPDTLTYSVPAALRSLVRVGVPVVVPLGGRSQLGYVMEVTSADLLPVATLGRLRPLHQVTRPDPAFDAAVAELVRAIGHEYRCSTAEALPLFVPERYGMELRSIVSLADWDGTVPLRVGLLTRKALDALFEALRAAGGSLARDDLLKRVREPALPQALTRARKQGWIRLEQVLQPPRVQGLRVRAVTLTGGSANSSQPSDVAADPGGEAEPIAVIDAVEALVNEEELVTPMELSALLAGSLPASKASPSAPGAEIAQPDDDAVLTIPAETRPQRDRALGKRQAAVMEYLRAHPNEPIPQRELCSRLGVSSSVVQSLVARGLLQATEVAMRRAPLALDDRPDLAPELTPFQGAAADALVAATRRGEGEALLLFGVTGSGKTEVYLHAIERARGAGRTAALLVPEISLTAQVASAVRRRLGERVAILHSALSEGERFDEWERLRKGEADVVVGPRSALFAPLKDPALIILDEEHDSSYKQDAPTPRYHAREVAMERARISRGCVVLGSATPSLESFHAALEGRHLLLELPERVRQRPLPAVEVVDLRTGPGARATTPRATVFSERLHDGIRERLDRGEQTILFLNRRGFSSFLLCRDCGYVPHCPSCDVSLTLHRQRTGVLLCHHCNYLQTAPESCRRCDSTRLRQFGLGTQRVEAEVRELFPAAKVARLDRDSVTGKDAHARIVQAVHDGEIDILVGTQMVTKGFDFPGVTLVGVVTADVALNMPDFRAGERAFQILTQVSGRAGRGDRAGEVVVQTFNPEHPSVQSASRHDYRGFFGAEIGHRKELGYPPFGSLARLVASHREDAVAQGRLEAAAGLLSPAVAQNEVQLLGPVSCPLGRLQDRYRRHLLLKGKDRAAIRAVLDVVWPEIQRRVGGIVVDVEPQSLM